MIKVAAINYLNSIPFIYGLEHHPIREELDIIPCVPSVGADMVATGKADIGIIPVGAAIQIPNHRIVTDYCIGATSTVASVLLCSGTPLQQIKKIYLDTDSRTSVLLCRILCKKYWGITPEFESFDFSQKQLNPNDSYVIIGDKAMLHSEEFKYVYDLAQQWIEFKQKPFVFAAWVTTKDLESGFITRFNDALRLGISSIDKIIEEGDFPFSKEFVKNYFTNNISYNLDSYKLQGLQDFWSIVKEEIKI